MLGFERHSDGPDRTGFMFNMRVVRTHYLESFQLHNQVHDPT